MKNHYINQLIADCEVAKLASPFKKLKIEHEQDVPSCLINGRGIYVFKEVGGNPQITFSEFEAYKMPDGKVKSGPGGLPRINAPSGVMYVGSSRNSLKSRLCEHLGSPSNRGTSALRLQEWFSGKYEIDVLLFDVSNSVLQIVEDNLSDVLSPAFGKQGGNGK